MLTITKENQENNREFAYRFLYENIITLHFAPGTKISELSLAEQLSISRSPIREALGQLQKEKLVATLPQRYTVVTLIDVQLIQEGYLFRNLVEPKIYCEIKGTLDQSLINSFVKNLEEQKKAIEKNNIFHFNKLDDNFHELLYRAARKTNIWKIRRFTTGHFDRIRYLVAMEEKVDIERVYEEHLLILNHLVTATPNEINLLYTNHFSAYQPYIALLLEKYPRYFKLPRDFVV